MSHEEQITFTTKLEEVMQKDLKGTHWQRRIYRSRVDLLPLIAIMAVIMILMCNNSNNKGSDG